MLRPRLKRIVIDKQVASAFTEVIKKGFSDRTIEIVSSILLSFAGIATSWSGYQSTLWSGIQAASYNRATAMRLESARASTEAGQLITVDIDLFVQWLNAYAEPNDQVAEFYRKRFRPEFVPAFDAWIASKPKLNPKALPTPFAQPEYRSSEREKARSLNEQSAELFERGQESNEIADNYVLNTVVLAMVMFLCSIAQQFKGAVPRIALISVSGLMVLFGLYNFLIYPLAD